jgi:hypothetical protein
MSATFSIDLDAETLRLADEEARAQQTTLSEVVAQQLKVMAENRQQSRTGKTPITDSLRGAVKLPTEFDERQAIEAGLREKYGERG